MLSAPLMLSSRAPALCQRGPDARRRSNPVDDATQAAVKRGLVALPARASGGLIGETYAEANRQCSLALWRQSSMAGSSQYLERISILPSAQLSSVPSTALRRCNVIARVPAVKCRK